MGVCRVCGCTDEKACAGGCAWFEPDLCSLCALAAGAIAEWAARAANPDIQALIAEAQTIGEPDEPENLIVLP